MKTRTTIELPRGLEVRQLAGAFASQARGEKAAEGCRSPRRWRVVVAALMFCTFSVFADAPAENWIYLFNGTNLDGWTAMNDGKFSVTNGAIQIEGGMGWLRTDRVFTNFVLAAEWRGLETNYNSGFFLRAGLAGKPMPTNGWQVNLKQADLGAWLKNKDIKFSPKPPVGKREGNYLEATASAMFVCALAKGVNRGYRGREHIPAIEKGYDGILKNPIHDDGNGKWSLTKCGFVAGLCGSPGNGKMRDGSFKYYIGEAVVNNDLKGIGPFILAGIEMERLR